jgi:putative RecB family exonuclease
MSNTHALQAFNEDLHISHNQIFTYATCSLKYRFHYVERRSPERVSIALPFGGAIHAAVETAYRSIRDKGRVESVVTLIEVFEEVLNLDLEKATVPIVYKKGTPDQGATLEMGKALLQVFHEFIAQTVQSVQQVVAVELPLSATLYTDDGTATEFKLVGVLDLLLMDEAGEIVVVDHKTAVQPMNQTAADDSLQMSAYAYLLATNRYVFPTATVKCRFDVLRKLKTPKLEQVHTARTARDRKRFAKIANAVLAGIDAGIYMPQACWMCADCAYSDACKEW